MLNIHASLLPQLRGAAPIVYAILKNLNISGITIMKIKPNHFDTGEIIHQKTLPLLKNEMFCDLRDRLADLGAELLIKTIKELPECFWNSKRQDCNLATYAPKINESLTKVRWDQMNALDIYNTYRALFSFKFLVTLWEKEVIKLKYLNIDLSEKLSDLQPGSVRFSLKKNCLLVTCADKKLIEVYVISTGKKSKMSAKDFYNGFISKKCESEQKFRNWS